MPSDTELAPLYGYEYNSGDNDGLRLESDPRAVDWIMGIVQSLNPDRFVDYGCGSGELLRRVATTGVEAVGFDLDAAGVEEASLSAGCTAYTYADVGDHLSTADVLHIGDVLEHVSNPMALLDEACSLLRPGGTLLVEGPLEANLSVFNGVLAVASAVKLGRPVEMPPYHVHLITARGQQRLLGRAGLTCDEFETGDTAWPAPGRWDPLLVRHPRLLSLFLLRKLSGVAFRFASRKRSDRIANRFRYRGTKSD
tara:strand:+ start:11982 stop:12740 length:759 start_codon:yes stop_codon:yes gene_type:complete